MKTMIKTILALAASAVIASTALAQNPPIDEPSISPIETAQRGQLKREVEARFGEPIQRLAAVGDPPISRWVYPGFTVYFEYEHVITSVVTRRG